MLFFFRYDLTPDVQIVMYIFGFLDPAGLDAMRLVSHHAMVVALDESVSYVRAACGPCRRTLQNDLLSFWLFSFSVVWRIVARFALWFSLFFRL